MEHGLLLIDPTLPDPMLMAIRLHPIEGRAHTFRADAKDGYASHGEAVVFELDATGRPTRMRVGQSYFDAVESW